MRIELDLKLMRYVMPTINDLKEDIKKVERTIEEINDDSHELYGKTNKDVKYKLTEEYYLKLLLLKKILNFKKEGITQLNSFKRLINHKDIDPCLYESKYGKKNSEDLKKEELLEIFKAHMNFNYLKETGNGGYIITIKDDHHVRYNKPFYETEDYFDKQTKRIKRFLLECKKVAIDQDMILIPFQVNDEFYYINIDNLSENLFLSDYEAGFRYINKQSNLYDIIQSLRREELNDNLEYKGHLLEELRKNTSFNKKLINEIYDKPNLILDSKYLIQRFTKKYKLRNGIN